MKRKLFISALVVAFTIMPARLNARIVGDITQDGLVDVDDVNMAINIILNLNGPGTRIGHADVSGDGMVDVTDVNEMLNFMLGVTPIESVEDYDITPSVTPASDTDDKEFLQKTAIAFMNQFVVEDFRPLAEVVRTAKDYDRSELESWAKGCLDAVSTVMGNPYTTTETSTWSYENETWEHQYITTYTDYKWMLKAAAFTGHFTVNNGKWVREDADDLQIEFVDRLGNKCVAKFVTSGQRKTVHVINSEDETDYNWYEIDEYHGVSEVEMANNKIYLEVPEHIKFTFTQGSKTLISTDVDFDLSKITGEDWDLNRDGIGVEAKANVCGYTFIAERTGYSPQSGVKATAKVMKGDAVLLYGGCTVNGYADYSIDDMVEENEFDSSTIGKATFGMNILGWLQARGSISNVHSMLKAMDGADENYDNETEFRYYVDRMNSLLNTKFYYRDESRVRGTLSVEPFLDYEWYDMYNGNNFQEWAIKPVITFTADNSSYDIEEYFNEDAFNAVITLWRNMYNDCMDLYDATGLER